VARDLSTGVSIPFAAERLNMMPRFTPDGRELVFVSDRETGRQELWVQPIDIGRTARRLTDQPGGEADHPAVSPTGRWVAYYSVTANQRDICIVSFSAGPPTRVTLDPADDLQPAWSPDEKWLAFVSERDSTPQIWKIPVANGQPTGPEIRITTSATKKEAPEWSPDGQRIAFVSGPTPGESEVWVVRADGTDEPRPVTKGAGARRLRWFEKNRMVVNGLWGANVMSLRSLDVDTGEATSLSKYADLSDDTRACDFDIDPAGRRLVFARQTGQSTIWAVTKRR